MINYKERPGTSYRTSQEGGKQAVAVREGHSRGLLKKGDRAEES